MISQSYMQEKKITLADQFLVLLSHFFRAQGFNFNTPLQRMYNQYNYYTTIVYRRPVQIKRTGFLHRVQ